MSRSWKVLQSGRNVFQVRIQAVARKDWEQWFLLTSDQHWDNPKSNHELIKKHLDEAKDKRAGVISCGDFFCAMQGKYDKRSNKNSIRPEHQNDDYLDSLVTTAADFFEPYAENLMLIGMGNHEQAIVNRHETNLIDRLSATLYARTKHKIFCGGFSGWIVFSFNRQLSEKKTDGSIVLHYDHGYGGGGAVTADMIQHYRRAVYLPDADIVMSGHTHDSWIREITRVRLSHQHTLKKDVQTHIKLPSYKDDYGDGHGGWAASKGHPPKPLGAYWLRFFYDVAAHAYSYQIVRAI